METNNMENSELIKECEAALKQRDALLILQQEQHQANYNSIMNENNTLRERVARLEANHLQRAFIDTTFMGIVQRNIGEINKLIDSDGIEYVRSVLDDYFDISVEANQASLRGWNRIELINSARDRSC
jgi:hypothetical protein